MGNLNSCAVHQRKISQLKLDTTPGKQANVQEMSKHNNQVNTPIDQHGNHSSYSQCSSSPQLFVLLDNVRCFLLSCSSVSKFTIAFSLVNVRWVLVMAEQRSIVLWLNNELVC